MWIKNFKHPRLRTRVPACACAHRVCAHTRLSICAHTHLSICARAHLSVCTRAPVRLRAHVRLHARAPVRLCARAPVRLCARVCLRAGVPLAMACWAYGVVVSMFDFHRSDRASNPGSGGKIS